MAAASTCASKDKAARPQRWWVYRYGAGGKRYHGLGPVHTISLAEAREQARRCRQLLLEGVDPIAAGKARRAAVGSEPPAARRSPVRRSLPRCALRGLDQSEARHESGRPRSQTHVLPEIGALPVADVDTADGHARAGAGLDANPGDGEPPALAASRACSTGPRRAAIARARTRRAGAAISTISCPPRKKLARVKHHAALPYRELPAFMRRAARAQGDRGARAGIRDPDCGARRRSCRRGLERDRPVDAGGIWIVPPAERIKSRREHRVPLVEGGARDPGTDAARAPARPHLSPARAVHMVWKLLRRT